MPNTFEWCREGVSAEIDHLQNIPIDAMECWFEAFEEQGEFYISSLSDDYHPGTKTYEILQPPGNRKPHGGPHFGKRRSGRLFWRR